MPLSQEKLKSFLKNKIDVVIFDEIDSTNNEAKRRLHSFSGEPILFAASSQTAGRGSKGRSFFSPKDAGLYMTLMLPIPDEPAHIQKLTCAAAVAAADAIESLTPHSPNIKWINDVYVDGKKVCGILCELVSDIDNIPRAVIAGIGVNLTVSDFPDGLRAPAGSIGDVDKNLLCARITDNLIGAYASLSENTFFESYKARSNFLGKTIVCRSPSASFKAKAVDLAPDGSLIVETDKGLKTLRSGEISILVE